MSYEGQEKIPLALQRRLADAPDQTVYLLLHASEMGPTQVATIERSGYVVRHQTTIIPCFAVSGPARRIQELAKEAWLVRVEEDSAVHTMQE